MDLPIAPQDTELRNIIDKLAQFVARNGPEFEQMTKNKQKGNAKFQFLYGGEYFQYYQCKVSNEQAILKQQGLWGPPPPTTNQSPNNSMNLPITIQLNTLPPPPIQPMNELTTQIKSEIDTLHEQIAQSEANLQAQHAVILQQQQAQIEVLLSECELKYNETEACEFNISLNELNQLLGPIIENCTKDSIQSGKSWILLHANTKEKALCIAHCLLIKVMQGSPTFTHRLHVIYLVNDVLHHCARKNAEGVKNALESVVVPMFCTASVAAVLDEQKLKLDKLLQLWESKANYLAPSTVEAMRNPLDSLQTFKTKQICKFSDEIKTLVQQIEVSFESYRTQHQAFVMHASTQIHELEQRAMEEQMRLEELERIASEAAIAQMNPTIPPPHFPLPPPPSYYPPPNVFPDFTRPPPGFPPVLNPAATLIIPTIIENLQEDLMPSVPYYELPAGLIVPLIKLEQTKFKSINPLDIRLPPPAPPSERLLTAVEAFYALPSHERPRDSEGWEKLGLYEYYKAKNNAIKEFADVGLIEASCSPISCELECSPSPPRRRYASLSPLSPVHSVVIKRGRSRSRTRSHSPPPTPQPRRSEKRSKRRKKTRSKSRSPTQTFRGGGGGGSGSSMASQLMSGLLNNSQESVVDSSNKGHQMLKRMGWGGSGLGVNEQGIDAPISGGDVRDRQDQFKGIGCNLNDPYENFRKNKGAAFITRMKARAEERAQESYTPSNVMD